jgi:phytoene dehydrogenase-like protein
VIGSGIGGLSTAALLSAAYGKSVCVLESHSLAGGAAHSFTRTLPALTSGGTPRTFTFDSGPHLFSGLTSGGGAGTISANPMMHVLRAADAPLQTVPYQTWGCLFPDDTYHATSLTPSPDNPLFAALVTAVSGPEAAREVANLLAATAPLSAAAVALPPAALRASDALGSLRVAARFLSSRPGMILDFLRALPLLSKPFSALLDAHVKDPFARDFLNLLCFLLAGVDAEKIPAVEVAFMFAEWSGDTAGDTGSVLEHPIGGAGGIVDALVEAIKRNNLSTVRLGAHVSEVLFSNGDPLKRRAVGVKLRSGEIIHARHAVVSNVSAWDLPRLIPGMPSVAKVSQLDAGAKELEMLPSFVHLHLAFEITDELTASLPRELMLNYVSVRSWERGVDAPQNVALISIPSVVDPSVAPPGHIVLHACEWRRITCSALLIFFGHGSSV